MAVALLASGCAGEAERQGHADLRAAADTMTRHPGDSQATTTTKPPTDGRLESYVAYGMRHSPALRASFERWRAATHVPQRARKLPEPTITYAAFVRSVETRVGPQQHKLGIMQWLPWPTGPAARGEAAAQTAVVAQRRFEGDALDLAARVSRAYYRLWLIQRSREVQRAQRAALVTLAERARAQLELGRASLADLAQLDLAVTRLEDKLAELDEAEMRASAALVRSVGAPPDTPTPIAESAGSLARGTPAEDEAALREAASEHPRVRAHAAAAAASEGAALAADAEGLPAFGVGAEWIITGDAANPMVPDSGKDPVIVMLSMRVPLWQGAYSAAEDEARARSAAQRALEADARDAAVEEVARLLSELRDAARRTRLYDTTLVPQAESAFESASQHYQSGGQSLASLLLAERELLSIRLETLQAQAAHAVAWAELERVVGRPVQGSEVAP